MSPVFVESVSSPEMRSFEICRKIVSLLVKSLPPPIPFASSPKEIDDVLAALKTRGIQPRLFVVNTLWAEDLIQHVDVVANSTPVILLRRAIMPPTGPLANNPYIEITYGSAVVDEIAGKMAQMIQGYMIDGLWCRFEDFSQIQALTTGRPDDMYRHRRKSGIFKAL